jgi:hypothetical protein
LPKIVVPIRLIAKSLLKGLQRLVVLKLVLRMADLRSDRLSQV